MATNQQKLNAAADPVNPWTYRNPADPRDMHQIIKDIERLVKADENPWAYRNPKLTNPTTGKPETRDTYQILRDTETAAQTALRIAKTNAEKLDAILAKLKGTP